MQNLRSWFEPAKLSDFGRRFAILNAGLFLFALGVVVTAQAGLGYISWDVFHRGLSLHTPLSFGQASQLTGLVVIGVGLLLGIKPALGTIMNMLMVGFWADQLLRWEALPAFSSQGLWAELLLLAVGVLVVGLGSGLYLKARMGAGPRDGLMLGLAKITGWRVSLCRTALEIVVCTIGALLGGPVGIGTLLVALTLGPAVELGFWVCRVQDPRRQPIVAVEV